MHRFLPAVFSSRPGSNKHEPNVSVETGLSRPTTMVDVPIIPALDQAFFKSNEVPAICNVEEKKEPSGFIGKSSFIERVKQSYGEHRQREEEFGEGRDLKEKKNEGEREREREIKELEGKKFNSEAVDLSRQVKLSSIPEVIEKPLRHDFFVFPGPSPDIFSNSSRLSFHDKNLPVLEISPIKYIGSNDDFADIMSVISNTERLKSIPDVFIRSNLRSKQLPILKPTTPSYFTKRRIIPVFRQTNKELLKGLT